MCVVVSYYYIIIVAVRTIPSKLPNSQYYSVLPISIPNSDTNTVYFSVALGMALSVILLCHSAVNIFNVSTGSLLAVRKLKRHG